MAIIETHPTTATIPRRGEQLPHLAGAAPDGSPIRTRDYYMRRNLALVVARDDAEGRDWLAEAAAARDRAQQEAGEIVAVIPPGLDPRGLPALVDHDGSIAARLGLAPNDLPALFVLDRYGTLFATNRGDTAVDGLRPSAIPTWLEFIACRCS